MEEEKIDPGHGGIRDVLRVVGPIVAVIGLIFGIVGIASFFSALAEALASCDTSSWERIASKATGKPSTPLHTIRNVV